MTRYKNINGTKIQFTPAEETARDAEELAWTNGAFDRAMADLREKRNRLIAETDHLALSDQTLSSAMSTYRTNLRNITNGLTTVDDVNNVTWPTKPSE